MIVKRARLVELERAYALVRRDLIALGREPTALTLENREHDLHARVYDLNRELESK
jgi:hypothetical protein